jgi:hypothetical protein
VDAKKIDPPKLAKAGGANLKFVYVYLESNHTSCRLTTSSPMAAPLRRPNCQPAQWGRHSVERLVLHSAARAPGDVRPPPQPPDMK